MTTHLQSENTTYSTGTTMGTKGINGWLGDLYADFLRGSRLLVVNGRKLELVVDFKGEVYMDELGIGYDHYYESFILKYWNVT